jgi:hypothetical protein
LIDTAARNRDNIKQLNKLAGKKGFFKMKLMKNIQQMAVAGVVVAGLCSASCKGTAMNTGTLKNATITGFDARGCPCCGGLMLTFTKEIKPYTGTFYLIDNDPAEFNITTNSTFPIFVQVQYTALEKCTGNYIHIIKLTRR